MYDQWLNSMATHNHQSRMNCQLPDRLPFNGRDQIQTVVGRPMMGECGGNCGIAQFVEAESALRANNSFIRDTFGQCDDLRSLEIPYAWSMNYLPHGGVQQPDDLGRLRDHTRINLANVSRPIPQDESQYYNSYYACRVNPHPDCTRNSMSSLESMHTTYMTGV